MGTAEFDLLDSSDVKWQCCKCDNVNINSFSYHSYSLDQTHDYYAPSTSSNCDDLTSTSIPSPNANNSSSNNTFKSPLKASTPKRPDLNAASPNSSSNSSSGNSNSHNTSGNSEEPLIPPKTNLRILNLNCRGLQQKTSELKAIIDYIKPDIVCGTESFLRGIKPGKNPELNSINSPEIFPPFFNVYRNDRNSDGGGVFILIHQNLVSMEAPQLVTDCEITWAKIHLKGCKELYISTFYMPHRNIPDLNALDASLLKVNEKGNRHTILCGDFNCPDVDWKNYTVNNGASDRPVQDKLVEVAQAHSLSQLQREPTRYSNILDLTFTNNPSLIKSCTVIPGISDHSAVVIDSIIRPNYVSSKKRKVFQYKKAQWTELEAKCDEITKDIQTRFNSGDSINELWELFKVRLLEAIDKHVPSKNIRMNNDLPWMNGNLRKLVRKKTKLHKQAKKKRDWTKFNQFQKTCKAAFRKAELDYVNNNIKTGLENNNTKPLWRYIKGQRNDNIGVSPLKEHGQIHSESKAKAGILLRQFSSVFTKTAYKVMPRVTLRVRKALSAIKIEEKGVANLLSKIQPHKAPGPDNLPNMVLKQCASNLAPAVTLLFQKSLDSGILPKDWTDANVTPIYKKGDRQTAGNYRPVSLTSVLSKCLEHIVCHEMHKHFDKHKVLTNRNHGFRKGYSCETQLTITVDELCRNLDRGLQTDVAILDFSKAFDKVPHDLLLHKLDCFGIRGHLHTWIKSFLTNRQMRVIVENEASAETTVHSGVPQGTVLGPLLFLCHINDLPDRVKSSIVRLFADDCLLYRTIRSPQDHHLLQEDLRQLEAWASDWGMEFNAAKCYILSINSKSSFFYQLNDTILKHVDNNPYLGLLISKDLKWASHIDKVSKKASSTLGFIQRNLRHCPLHCRKSAYLALVRSTLEYGSVVWDPHLRKDVDKLEKVQRKAARFIKGDYHSREPGSMSRMLNELDLPTLESRRKDNRLCFMFKISRGTSVGYTTTRIPHTCKTQKTDQSKKFGKL